MDLWMRTGQQTGFRPERRRREEEERLRGTELTTSSPAGEEDVKMGLVLGLLWLFTGFLQGAHGQGVYGEYVTNAHFLPYMFTCSDTISRPHRLDLVRDLASC